MKLCSRIIAEFFVNSECAWVKKRGNIISARARNVIEGKRAGMVKSRLYLEKERLFTDYSVEEFRNILEDVGFEIVAEITGKETKEDSVWINIISRSRK